MMRDEDGLYYSLECADEEIRELRALVEEMGQRLFEAHSAITSLEPDALGFADRVNEHTGEHERGHPIRDELAGYILLTLGRYRAWKEQQP